MSRAPESAPRAAEPAGRRPLVQSLQERVLQLETTMRAIEEELSDEELDDEQKLQNIGERVAGLMEK